MSPLLSFRMILGLILLLNWQATSLATKIRKEDTELGKEDSSNDNPPIRSSGGGMLRRNRVEQSITTQNPEEGLLPNSNESQRRLAAISGATVAGFRNNLRTSASSNADFLNGDIDARNWFNLPKANVFGPETTSIDVDLGKQFNIDAVTIWHYYVDTRQYQNQKLEVSRTGAFSGEQEVIYDVDLGPVETEMGNTITPSSPMIGRYIRHTCGRNTRNFGVHFIGLRVFGVEAHATVVGTSSNVNTSASANTKFLDRTVNAADWANHPNAEASAYPLDAAYIDVDLGKVMDINSVTIWHKYLDSRKYKHQKLEVSRSGAFDGEQEVIYKATLGPAETREGNTIFTSSVVKGRYIRHTCGGNTVDQGIHFIGLKVDGTEFGELVLRSVGTDTSCMRIEPNDMINLQGKPIFVDTDASGTLTPTPGDMMVGCNNE